LGDTEYKSATDEPASAVFQAMREHFTRSNLRVAVLHIGSSQLKSATGKHLYLPGLIDLLKDIEFLRRKSGLHDKLLVLVSEWGLEHASREQLARALVPKSSRRVLSAFGPNSLVTQTIEAVTSSWDFANLTVLPADIGLAVGLESGRIYLEGARPVEPEDVIVKTDREGLTYHARRSVRRPTR
jgi:hypothetical protein